MSELTHAAAVAYVAKSIRRDLGRRVRVVENRLHHLEWVTRSGLVARVFVTMGPADIRGWQFELPEPGTADGVAFALWRGRRFAVCATWGAAAAREALRPTA
jgi:hypothetical protein